MLHLMYPRLQIIQTLSLPQINLFCYNRLARIHLCNNLVDHHPRSLNLTLLPRLPGPLDSPGARKLPRQRRVQVYNLDARIRNRVEEVWRQDVHPARAYNNLGPRIQLEDEVGERGIVFGAGSGRAFLGLGVLPLERDEVVVGGWDGGVGGAGEAVGCFTTRMNTLVSDCSISRRGRTVRTARDVLRYYVSDARIGEGRGCAGVDEGLEVGTIAGDEDYEIML